MTIPYMYDNNKGKDKRYKIKKKAKQSGKAGYKKDCHHPTLSV